MAGLNSDSPLPSELQEWRRKLKEVSILVTGKTGVGKSALINCLVGEEVAEEGDSMEPVTTVVRRYEADRNGISVSVWDSPGLQDGTGNENYIRSMRENCEKVDLILICIRMLDVRFSNDDQATIEEVTRAFGVDIWKNAVVVLTCANQKASLYNREKYDASHRGFKGAVYKVLTGGKLKVPRKVAETVPVVPAGYIPAKAPTPEDRKLPGCTDWLSNLWNLSFLKMKEAAQPAMLKHAEDRFKKREDITEEDQRKPGHQQPIVLHPAIQYGVPGATSIVGAAVTGAITGATYGAVGGVVGAGIGGVLGLLAGGILTYFAS